MTPERIAYLRREAEGATDDYDACTDWGAPLHEALDEIDRMQGTTRLGRLVAVVDWDPRGSTCWQLIDLNEHKNSGHTFKGAVDGMLAVEKRHYGHPLRWECAGPHRFHGYAKDPEPAYESELP